MIDQNKRKKNWAIFGGIIGFIVLIYLISIIKIMGLSS